MQVLKGQREHGVRTSYNRKNRDYDWPVEDRREGTSQWASPKTRFFHKLSMILQPPKCDRRHQTRSLRHQETGRIDEDSRTKYRFCLNADYEEGYIPREVRKWNPWFAILVEKKNINLSSPPTSYDITRTIMKKMEQCGGFSINHNDTRTPQ